MFNVSPVTREVISIVIPSATSLRNLMKHKLDLLGNAVERNKGDRPLEFSSMIPLLRASR